MARRPPPHLHLEGQHAWAFEEGFGWLKGIAGLGRSRVVGRWKIQQLWEVGAAAYNFVRMRSLLAAA